MHADTAPGWYGKLSMLGDFASRRLESDWVRSCDAWISSGLRTSQQALGEQWRSAYLAAPVWRFAWGPGIVDARWWFGVFMPSCDSVGRYYPLLIAQPRQQPPMDRVALDHLEAWWSQLARAGLATLLDGATLESFEAGLAHAPPWPSAARGPWLRPQPGGDGERWQVAPGAGLHEVALSLSVADLVLRLNGASLWWPVVEPGVAGSLLLQPGLPPAQQFAQLLGRPG